MNMTEVLNQTAELLSQKGRDVTAVTCRQLAEAFSSGKHLSPDNLSVLQRFSYNADTAKIHSAGTRTTEVRFTRMLEQLAKLEWTTQSIKTVLSSSDQRQLLGEYFGQVAQAKATVSDLVKVSRDIQAEYAAAHLGSCMHIQGGRGHPSLATYDQSDCLRVATIRENGTMIARALLWSAVDSSGKQFKVMDRIYPADSNARGPKLMIKHAQEQQWDLRDDPTGRGSTYKTHLYTLLELHQNGVPYVDTFNNLCGKFGSLLLISTNPRAHMKERIPLTNTDGNRRVAQIEDFNEADVVRVAQQLYGKDDPRVPKIRSAEAQDYVAMGQFLNQLAAF